MRTISSLGIFTDSQQQHIQNTPRLTFLGNKTSLLFGIIRHSETFTASHKQEHWYHSGLRSSVKYCHRCLNRCELHHCLLFAMFFLRQKANLYIPRDQSYFRFRGNNKARKNLYKVSVREHSVCDLLCYSNHLKQTQWVVSLQTGQCVYFILKVKFIENSLIVKQLNTPGITTSSVAAVQISQLDMKAKSNVISRYGKHVLQ